ncbi:Ctr-domain-containing protein [Polyporus arcularius HHB13444]|uniref:Copper transport protein n=1 Tax=Polyporus arcularius HHB13444 TaxID=1314778 RepID=A0A5C3P6S3_9APHY|nr:Ctr-domain-containing protein [Polyporus arcularius HHB13444]
MDMSGMSSHTATSTSASASATGAAMSMGGMGGSSSCKISMLWNWYTVDSCFIARSWHVTSKGAFAGSCIGVIFLVIALELLRRLQREFDRYFHRVNGTAAASCCSPGVADGSDIASNKGLGVNVPTLVRSSGVGRLQLWQQLARAALFTVQFAVGYFVMLLAMYYNGYIIICIFIGAFLGAAMFQWDTYYACNE